MIISSRGPAGERDQAGGASRATEWEFSGGVADYVRAMQLGECLVEARAHRASGGVPGMVP